MGSIKTSQQHSRMCWRELIESVHNYPPTCHLCCCHHGLCLFCEEVHREEILLLDLACPLVDNNLSILYIIHNIMYYHPDVHKVPKKMWTLTVMMQPITRWKTANVSQAFADLQKPWACFNLGWLKHATLAWWNRRLCFFHNSASFTGYSTPLDIVQERDSHIQAVYSTWQKIRHWQGGVKI